MTIIDEFFKKYNNQGIDYDGYYGFQCMDLYQQYNKDVIGAPHIPDNASGVWTSYPKDFYEKVENTPNNFPLKGDVVIWNNNVGGGFGHIAVATGNETGSTMFESFDQNWPPGTKCHYQRHVFTNVIGWLRPKDDIITEDMPTYLKTLFQENGLTFDNESNVREFFEKARRYNGLKTDFDNCQSQSDRQAKMIAQLQKDVASLSANLSNGPKTAFGKLLVSFIIKNL